MNPPASHCPGCRAPGGETFYEARNVPVHSVLLMRTPEQARAYPRGDIRLIACDVCGLVWNSAFAPDSLEYSGKYEETQAYSASFNEFHRRLAQSLIDRYALRRKKVLEIGCGKGEFLSLLCELGDNQGVGFDPSFAPERAAPNARVRFVRRLYDETHGTCDADLVCCKMTLDHIQPVADFLGGLGRACAGRTETIVFFQVPDFGRVLREGAFWDIYYEHCSYFTDASLRGAFARAGFEVLDVFSEYNGQYLMIEGRPAPAEARSDLDTHAARISPEAISTFRRTCDAAIRRWRADLESVARTGRRTVVWGAGSKAVAFLGAVDPESVVEYAVDINPHKHGTFLPGGGQESVAPAFLRDHRPDVVIVMNPIYREEIAAELGRLGLECEVLCV